MRQPLLDMTPTTRTDTKRLVEANPQATVPNKKARTASDPSKADEQLTVDHCFLLELAPELRNRIYELSIEDFDGDEPECQYCGCNSGCEGTMVERGPDDSPNRWAPRAQQSSLEWPILPWDTRPWQFFGLTQACRQLREEYAPLWIRGLSVRLTVATFSAFVDVFLSKGAQPKHAPKVIQFSWAHDSDNYFSHDRLMPLIKLRALYPGVRFQFVPYAAADLKHRPGDDICEGCMELADRFGHFDLWDIDGCECIDPATPYHEYIADEQEKIEYTNILQAFLKNDNPAWAKAVLEGDVTSKWMNLTHDNATFKIICKDSFCHSVSNLQGAWDMLNGWGLLDLERREHMTFILAFEESEKMVIDGYEVKNSLVREFRVPKARLLMKAQ